MAWKGVFKFNTVVGAIHAWSAGRDARLYGRRDACRYGGARPSPPGKAWLGRAFSNLTQTSGLFTIGPPGETPGSTAGETPAATGAVSGCARSKVLLVPLPAADEGPSALLKQKCRRVSSPAFC